MRDRLNEKYNDGCIKIFKLLQLLYEDKAYYDDVINIFTEEDCNKQSVTLNKYLNTLKVFGIKINKVNNKYILQNNPFTKSFEIGDLKAIHLLERITNSLPEGKTKSEASLFINSIKNKFDDNSKLRYTNLTSTENKNYDFYYTNIREQIKKCEKICQEDYKVNIKYICDTKEVSAICNAKQVIYDNKNAYLRIYKIKELAIDDIPINTILSIEQLPSIKNEAELTTTILYKIQGRLAKAYNIKPNERVSEVLSDGSLLIVNTNEPHDKLIKRLLRYDSDCVIIRPKFLREKMLETINNTLKNYE